MTDRQAKTFCWATELAMTQQPVTLSVTEAREVSADMQRLHSENETLQAGYAAARLEIESLQARIKTMTEEQADELMVALSDAEIDRIVPALEPVSEDFPAEWAVWKDRERIREELRASHGQAPAQAAPQPSPTPQADSQPAHQRDTGYPPLPKPKIQRGVFPNLFTEDQMRAYVDADRALRASHGQAPAQQPGTAYVVPEVLDALNWVDDFIARCNGDDRGACESVNVLRRAFASHGQAPVAQTAPAPGERCQHCIDRHDGIYGSWAAPCPYHDDDGKPRPTANAAPQQEAQEPCPTCAALARTVMLDQVSFDRKPDCYGIRQITDDEGVEEWEDIRTSPDVAREEANDMMATGRGEIYEVVPALDDATARIAGECAGAGGVVRDGVWPAVIAARIRQCAAGRQAMIRVSNTVTLVAT